MSQLIQLKQRIKAIEVIKKITHAMRLIAMSSHSKLKKQSTTLQNFKDELTPLLCALEKFHNTQKSISHVGQKHLWILIGSEKGLCGNFNTLNFSHFNQQLHKITVDHDFISIGKQATKFLHSKKVNLIKNYDKLSPNKLSTTTDDLYNYLLENGLHYKTVTCFYSSPKTFFTQEPTKFQLLPAQPANSCSPEDNIDLENYVWPQNHKDVTKCIFESMLKLNILYLLSQSMIAEQSARFLSMDSSTRSADNLLKNMHLEYNKIRQTKITKELSELASSF